MQIVTILAGANFRPAESREFLKTLPRGAQLRLERDPANPYDSSAIKVLADEIIEVDGDQGDTDKQVIEHFVGFVAKADNFELALILDGDQGEGDDPLFAEGHTPEVTRCEILDFVSGPLKPTIVIEVSTGFELGTLVKSDTDGDGEDDFLPEGDE